MIKRIILFIAVNMFVTLVFSKTNDDYYTLLRKAEDKIISEELNSALRFYKKALEQNNYPFVRDIVSAACVAHYANDTSFMYKLIDIALKRGLSDKELEYFLNKRPDDHTIKQFVGKYDQYRSLYVSKVDKEYRELMGDLDIQNQVDISYGRLKLKLSGEQFRAFLNDRNKGLISKYIYHIKTKGFPTEKRVGIGSTLSLVTSNMGRPSEKGMIYKYLPDTHLEEEENDSIFFSYSYTHGTSIGTHRYKPGYSLLWHINIIKNPVLDSLLKRAVSNLNMHPECYASCVERNGEEYALGMGSQIMWSIKFKYEKIRKINESDRKEINKRRQQIGMRSVEADMDLFNAIVKLEKIKRKHHSGLNRKRNLFVLSLFSPIML